MSHPWRAVASALALSATCVCAQSLEEEGATGVLPTALFEEGFCTSAQGAEGLQEMKDTEINTNTMDCAKLMELVYAMRLKLWEQIENLRPEDSSGGAKASWKFALRAVSRGSSLFSAHVHILAAVASQRSECFSEQVRLLLVVNIRRMKALTTRHVDQLWMFGQDGPARPEDAMARARKWLAEASDLLNGDLSTMRQVLLAWRPPAAEEARFYSHEANGRFSTMETLRRDTFDEWQVDKGLLRGLVRNVFPIDAVVADFGAGSGKYATWLNDTGLVKAYAFDGSPDIQLVTKGVVLSAVLGQPFTLWRKFDWVICLEVAEHIPVDLSAPFLRNLDAHAEKGLVISWSQSSETSVGHANPRSEAEVLRLFQEHSGLTVDKGLTDKLRMAASLPQHSASLFVFVRSSGPACDPTITDGSCDVEGGTLGAARATGNPEMVAPGCGLEDGWIYAGNDVQMFGSVTSALACCELCSSHELCRFWTWSREDSHKELCWIKSTREYRINHDGFVSGVRRS